MRRRELLVNKTSGGIGGSITDVLFVKKDTLEKRIFSKSEWPSKSSWTPIGIVVVPSSHDRYDDDGTCGIMSLGGINKSGNIQTNGADDSSTMAWANNYIDTSLTNYTTINGSDSYGYVHFQTSDGSTSCSFYYRTPHIQYPYTELNGTVVQPSYTAGSLSDYDGIGNTNKLNSSEYLAAYACKQVSTLGTSKGDWYLPSAGELAYLPSIRYEVNKTITSLCSNYGDVGSLLDTSNYYWSSTEYNNNIVWYVYLDNGYVYLSNKGNGNRVRPFLRFNPTAGTIVR